MDTDRIFLELIQKRLHFILWECPPTEYNSSQTQILIETKHTLCKAAIPPIHLTYHNPTIQQYRVIHIPHSFAQKRNATAFTIAIAACLLTIILIGRAAPALAGPDSGFFLWLNRNNKGTFAITNPEAIEEPCTTCHCCPDCTCRCKIEETQEK